MIENDRRVRIISGHYGSGKTEFAVNYAVKLAETGRTPVLADIDVINPYFRSRERIRMLEDHGVRVVADTVNTSLIDVPAISAEVYTVFDRHDSDAVIDAGGGRAGIAVLKRFSDHFSNPEEYDFFLVINANRPETRSPAQIIEYIKSFENTCGLKVSGLINNTHMLRSTTAADIVSGYSLSVEVSEMTGIPLRYNAGLEKLEDELPEEIRKNFFPIELFMRDEWMS